jgi:hypothetical protein
LSEKSRFQYSSIVSSRFMMVMRAQACAGRSTQEISFILKVRMMRVALMQP